MSKKITTEEFIRMAKEVHGDKYDYSRVSYVKTNLKVIIICKVHGEFEQTPNKHTMGRGCPICANKIRGESRKLTKEEFLDRVHSIHNHSYDYVDLSNITSNSKIDIICKKHGMFRQNVASHLQGCGCPRCYRDSQAKPMKPISFYIDKAIAIHGNKYDYSNITENTNVRSKCGIRCIRHGIFYQRLDAHLQGQGCPLCKNEQVYSKGHKYVKDWLDAHNIIYEEEKTFVGMVYKSKLRLDFYIQSHTIAIEYNGEQHYIKRTQWDKDGKIFEICRKRDAVKREYCKSNGIQLVEIPFDMEFEAIANLLSKLLL